MAYDKLTSRYTVKEEIFNSITHGIGALLSIAALVILVAFGSIRGDVWRIVSFSIYGFTLFFLYMSSTLYHSIFHEKSKKVLRILDHVSIYLLIAGSYTPIALVSMRGAWGWSIFGVIWSLAIIGIILKILSINKIKYLSTLIYVVMGWLIIIAVKPMLTMAPPGLFLWLLTGGLIYTSGVIFYACKKIPFNHGIWHLFVLGGSIVHYLGILFYLAL
ncbi:PAQR family membrane homeostasis protein TrhA [Clostridium formicaceticum]|uniref:Hemolysin III n=1 Tax=Clostridium formicaceticum TaxID=1497 RepID=A0AAC9RMJ5_9CLOT|nr:hemolysin III family protein [Clostridium formicaceticum]AOY76615.1 hemolysin III [Clostridium formicaceticum]ARE87035.1 hemolysin-III related [Clostridium formicaceticum]